MGFYFRKSFGKGPFRVNLSKSGVSYSIGGKGARVNFSSRGTYVNFGSHGIYYRKKISGPGRRNRSDAYPTVTPPVTYGEHTITSGELEHMTDVDSQELINELMEKENKASLANWLGWLPFLVAIVGGLIYFFTVPDKKMVTVIESNHFVKSATAANINIRKAPDKNSPVLGVMTPGEQVALIDSLNATWYKVKVNSTEGYVSRKFSSAYTVTNHREIEDPAPRLSRYEKDNNFFWWTTGGGVFFFILLITVLTKIDRRRTTVELFYDIDEKVSALHDQFVQHFSELLQCSRVWQYLHSERTYDYKYTGGAGHTVNRQVLTRIAVNQPPSSLFRTNVQVPFLGLINTSMFFFPERLIIKRGKQYAAIMYKNLQPGSGLTRFIESETLPADAEVVGSTWQYLNKDGSPDRRFNGNRELPICRYSEYTFQSAQGLNEKISTSKVGALDAFITYLRAIGELQTRMQPGDHQIQSKQD
jgi:hypothetical protein